MNPTAQIHVAEDVADLFPTDTSYTPTDFKQKKNFHAWHRPRKQYVREEQWCAALNELVDSLDFDGRALRYLGLPGDELLDLRVIHEKICKPRNLKLRFLGFNTGAAKEGDTQFEVNLSQVELKSLDNVDQMSKVIPDDFKSLGTRNSVAWANASEFVHFDVVNIDLCDGLFTAQPGVTSDSYYNAIKELISLQSKRGGDPWLLFLTTRVGPTDVHRATVDKLKVCIKENISNCPRFLQAAERHLDLRSDDNVDAAFNNPHLFANVFSTGMGKWLIGLGLGSNPSLSVKLKTICSYTVNPGSAVPDLISAVYEFSPIPMRVEDRHGLAVERNRAENIPSECDLAAEIVPFVKNTLDIDTHLTDRPELFSGLVDRSADLMAKARYLAADYREWVESQYQN